MCDHRGVNDHDGQDSHKHDRRSHARANIYTNSPLRKHPGQEENVFACPAHQATTLPVHSISKMSTGPRGLPVAASRRTHIDFDMGFCGSTVCSTRKSISSFL